MTENLYSNKLEDELSELEDMLKDEGGDMYEEDKARLNALLDMKDDVYGWDDGVELVHEDNFQDLAEEMAKDQYDVDFSQWPFYLIDWKEAADDLEADYDHAELDGVTYYYR